LLYGYDFGFGVTNTIIWGHSETEAEVWAFENDLQFIDIDSSTGQFALMKKTALGDTIILPEDEAIHDAFSIAKGKKEKLSF